MINFYNFDRKGKLIEKKKPLKNIHIFGQDV